MSSPSAYRAIRFEGRVGLAAIFGGEWVMNLSPRGTANSCNAENLRNCGLKSRRTSGHLLATIAAYPLRCTSDPV